MSASFPKTNRIVDKKDYARVFDQPQRIVVHCLVLLYCSNSLTQSRLGLAISSKHVAKAVERNRIKRRIREFFRQRKEKCPGLDIVLVSRPALRNTDNRVLLRSLEELWRKLEERCGV